jgi:CHAT domain-containing protein
MLSSGEASEGEAERSVREPLNAGIEAFRDGRIADAIELWSAANAVSAGEGDVRGQLDALLRRAEAYQALGHFRRAAGDLAECRWLTTRSSDEPLRELGELCAPLGIESVDNATLAILAGSLGRTCAALGRPADAARLLEQSLALTKARPDLTATTLANLGDLDSSTGRPAAAARRYQESFDLAQDSGDPAMVASVAISAATAWASAIAPSSVEGAEVEAGTTADALGEAERWLARAAPRIAATRSPATRAWLHVAYASALLQMHERDPVWPASKRSRVRASLETAAGLAMAATPEDTRTLSFVYGYSGRLDELERRWGPALSLTQAALLVAQRLDDPALNYRWYWQTARILRGMGQPNPAITAYRRAREQLEKVRPDLLLAYGGFGESFRGAVSPIYLEYADLLLQRAGKTDDEEARQADLREARETVEQLKAAELEDYFQDDCVASLKARATGIDQLAPDTAALYPILLDDRMELILSLGGKLFQETKQVPRTRLREVAADFVRGIERRRGQQYLNPAQTLYSWLVEPFTLELNKAHITTLVIVPDGPLRTVPLAALHDGESFLIERYAIAVTPGLRLLDPRRISRDRMEVLLGALTEKRQGFEPLTHVSTEIDRITGIFATKPLTDGAFRDLRIKDELNRRPYTVVHLATHGEFAGDPKNSFLLTYDDKLTMDELEQFIKYSEFRDQPVELLGLSACETAAGDERAALGLAGVGVKAGARSVFATLWQVQDEAAAELVTAFYKRLKNPSLSKAEALQGAQQEFLQRGSTRNPGLWAPFILIGNWL